MDHEGIIPSCLHITLNQLNRNISTTCTMISSTDLPESIQHRIFTPYMWGVVNPFLRFSLFYLIVKNS